MKNKNIGEYNREEIEEIIKENEEAIYENKKVLNTIETKFKSAENFSNISFNIKLIEFFKTLKKINRKNIENEKNYKVITVSNNILANYLIGKDTEKHRIITNVILHKTECGKKVYYPLAVDCYCTKDFDKNRKYSFEELEDIMNNNKIVFEKKPYILEDCAENENVIGNLNKKTEDEVAFNFYLGKIKYNTFDNIKIKEMFHIHDYTKIILINKINTYLANLEKNSGLLIERVMSDLAMQYPNAREATLSAIKETCEKVCAEKARENTILKKMKPKDNKKEIEKL